MTKVFDLKVKLRKVFLPPEGEKLVSEKKISTMDKIVNQEKGREITSILSADYFIAAALFSALFVFYFAINYTLKAVDKDRLERLSKINQ